MTLGCDAVRGRYVIIRVYMPFENNTYPNPYRTPDRTPEKERRLAFAREHILLASEILLGGTDSLAATLGDVVFAHPETSKEVKNEVGKVLKVIRVYLDRSKEMFKKRLGLSEEEWDDIAYEILREQTEKKYNHPKP